MRDVLECALAQDFPERFEILVIDNAPATSAVRDIVEEYRLRDVEVRYVVEPKLGLHHARHAGARCARSEILAYLDDDVLMQPSWLQALVHGFSDSHVGCVGGPIAPRWEDGRPSWADEVSPHHFGLLDYGPEPLDLDDSAFVHGGNFAIRRETLWRSGGFAPDVFGKRRYVWLAGDGEWGLQKRVRQLGERIRYQPGALVEHRISGSRARRSHGRTRARTLGVEHSFVFAREEHPSRLASLRESLTSFLRAAYALLRFNDFRFTYWSFRGLHQLGVVLVPALRRYVHRPFWISEEDFAQGVAQGDVRKDGDAPK